MKKYLAFLFVFFGIILSSCTKADYSTIAEELNNEKYNFAKIEYDDESDDILCNYVKTVWDGKTTQFDVHNTVIYYSYVCDIDKDYKITANIPTNKNFKITNVTETYFYNFDYKNEEESKKIDYDLEDGKLSFNVDIKETNNIHIFQYYKINFKVDKTHIGYFYFSVRYGNELQSLKRTVFGLDVLRTSDIEYVNISTSNDPNPTTINSGPIFNEVVPAIESIYLLKLDNIKYIADYELILEIKIRNLESKTIRINNNYICSYDGNYYTFVSTNDLLNSVIKSLIPKEKGLLRN